MILTKEGSSQSIPPVSQRKAFFMQIDQDILLPPDEMRETALAAQVAAPDKRGLRGKGGGGGTTETLLAPPRVHRPLTLPAWPTSQPGPRVTAPPPGQKLVHFRTDQVMYDSYDQERGLPGLLPPMPANQEKEKHQ